MKNASNPHARNGNNKDLNISNCKPEGRQRLLHLLVYGRTILKRITKKFGATEISYLIIRTNGELWCIQ
jgi:hypothetical protein